MNEEICCITNEWKTAKDEWENGYSHFLQALYSVYKKLGQFFSHTLLAKHLSVGGQIFWKVNKWSIKTYLRFLKNTVYMCTIPSIKFNILGKVKCTSHTITCLTVFARAFCHTRVKNLLKGPV